MKKIFFLIVIIMSLIVIACHSRQWEDNDSLGTIKKGDIFKIEPLKDTTVEMSGSNFSTTDFTFKCTLLKPSGNLKYKGTTSLSYSSSRGSDITETMEGKDLALWPETAKEQIIKIPYICMPTIQTYKGSGKIYFYLADSTKTCISNIIGWKVKFK